MSQVLRQGTLVAAVATVVMFTNLGGPRLWDRDEPRNAGCAAEMQARGDWVTPVMNAELRTHKPVLLYWLMMTAYSVFGVNEFSARFWSAALAVGTSLCTYGLGRRLFNDRVGTWAGIVIATVLMFDVAGRAATPDSTLIFFSTLAITLYVLGTFPHSALAATLASDVRPFFPKWPWALAMYGVMGIAVLAKGPVGLILPTAVIGMFLLIKRLPIRDDEAVQRVWWHASKRAANCFGPRHFLRTCWSMRPITALTISLAVALPWYIWVGVRTDGEFLRGFFFEHNLARATQSMEGHGGSVLFYPVAILVGFFPWSVFAVPVLIDSIRHCKTNAKWINGYIFAACWVGVYVGLFSVAKTKLPSYVTPCYPALALLTGCFVDRWTRNATATSPHWLRAAFGITSLVGVVFLVGVPLAAQRFLPGDAWLGVIGVIPLAAGVIALVYSEINQPRRAAFVFATSSVLFTTLLFSGVATRVDRHQHNHSLLEVIEARGAKVASYGLLEPSWIFYGRRPIDELIVKDIRAPIPTWIERDGQWTRKPDLSVDEALDRDDECMIITSDHYWPLLQEELPEGYEILVTVPYFMRKGNLLLIGRTRPAEIAGNASIDNSKLHR
ncbi:MAG: glycosyltransferase family 39 protein [Planctomycetes bacterium]|nr:glycosyltransferase family 39 protein [Planctomycetota bacterium]